MHAISIHAPREGSDRMCSSRRIWRSIISIHAPREGSDATERPTAASAGNFYPRSPRGERQANFRQFWPEEEFLSTLPARGATVYHG